MATLRKITLNWEIRTGAITCDTGYIKRQELCDVDLYVTVDGTAYALDTSWALNLSIKPTLLGDNAALIAVTTWTASATTGLYQATAQTMGGTALDTYLAANNSDTTDDEGNKLVDLDVYYTISTAVKSKSDTVTLILKPDVGRADDTVPATIIARNDFLVSNGTGLLVNVAAGYAANGAFVAAQASLAITNATNYIEATAAGVASVNTTAFTAGSYPLATVVASAGAITANTDLRAWITPKPGGSGTVTSVAQSFTGGIISVAGSPVTVSGTLALTVAGTSGGVPYFSSGTTWATSAALAASALVVGGGAGAAPATITTGANVLTALGVAVGSAGSFITFNGHAGTPSALVGTNITGTASGLTAGNATLAATVTVANEASDTTCFPLFVTAATGSLAALSNAGLTFNSATGLLSATGMAGTTGTFSGAVTGTTFNAVPLNRGLGDAVRNVALGDYALAVSTTGNRDTAIGRGAMAAVTIGDDNVAIGTSSLFQNVSGNTNTAVGAEALFSATGSGNVALGYFAGFHETGSNSLYIDNQNRTNTAGDKAKALIYGTFAATAATQQLTINAGTITLNGSAVTATSYAGAGTGLTGTAASLTAGTVTTNANLTGHVTSVGNAAVLGSFTMAQLSAAVSDGDPAYVGAANTFTGTTNTFTLPTTTGTTTTSGIAVAANSLTTGTGVYAASSTLTSGQLMDLQVSGTAAAASQTALNVATAGANGTSGITSKGAVISNTHTGTTSTNVALELTASGGTTNTALRTTDGSMVLQTSPTKYTTITPGAVGGLVFTLTTDGSSLDANYGITLPGCLVVSGQNGLAQAITATGVIVTSGALQGSKVGWINNGNVGIGFSGTTVSTGSATTIFSVGASTESTTTATGAIVTAGGLGVAKNANIGGTLAVTGATTLTGNLTSNGAYISTPQALSGNGAVAAVNLTTLTTTIANTGTANTTTTLAAGTNGQTKIISFITDGGFDAVITVTNPAWGGAGTITMNDALDNVMLIYLNSVWQVFINNGCTLA